MPPHLQNHLAQGRHAPGILVLNPRMSAGETIEELMLNLRRVGRKGISRPYFVLAGEFSDDARHSEPSPFARRFLLFEMMRRAAIGLSGIAQNAVANCNILVREHM